MASQGTPLSTPSSTIATTPGWRRRRRTRISLRSETTALVEPAFTVLSATSRSPGRAAR
jgi:hypothetical protein